ncbi:hypothetical protein IWW36_000924 [Coemansia brasiliensis]|uniref:Uncharacterized protein n=1 Tax=Coemansia brasiliensis TaxID=2650707 RepID=A0A9W8IAC8_9FUNG|nr:hypothetical protein IWW36_000924 [Coemansia brasiliensis]
MLRPFRIPETRLLAINDLVAQVTLTFRTDEDEEVRYRYEQDREIQSLVQTAVVSLVNCGYTNGIARGPGFVLHQLRKKWPIGRRYIFTRHGEPLQSSLHKYFFQLELVDDMEYNQQDAPILEITELRAVGMSPSASSIAGSTIEGLDAVSLPPMAAMFGQGYSQMGDISGHRRSGSVHSGYSGRSGYSSGQRPRSPFYYDSIRQQQRPESPSPRKPGVGELETEYQNARQMVYSNQPHDTQVRGSGRLASMEESPAQSTVRTRSVSRSSVGSGRTMQSIEIQGRASQTGSPLVRPSTVAESASRAAGTLPTSSSRTPARHSATLASEQPRIGRTSWYRSLHGISPLSRNPKSLSSSDNEAILGAVDAAATEPATQIPRVAGNGGSGPANVTRPPRAPSVKESGLTGLANRFRRKVLSPINIHRSKQEQGGQRGSSFEISQSSGASSDDVDTSDFTRSESDEMPAKTRKFKTALTSAIPLPSSLARRAASDEGKRKLGESSTSSNSSAAGISRPDMPPPKRRPLRQQAPTQSSSEPLPEPTSIPVSVKNALLRRLKSPLDRHPDRTSSRLSVRERIAAFNNMTVTNDKPQASASTKLSNSTASAAAVGVLTPVTQESTDGSVEAENVSSKLREAASLRQKPNTPVSTILGRTRIGTSTGFISVASPGTMSQFDRPQSRASSNGRPASPALSHMSNVSTRIQDAINALERASSAANNGTTPQKNDMSRDGASHSGTKRSAAAEQYMASPTKRPRAPSAAGYDGAREGSRLNPLSMMQRMVRRHTGR